MLLALLSAIAVCEAAWSVVLQRRLQAEILSLRSQAERGKELTSELGSVRDALEEARAKHLRLEERTEQLDTKLNASTRARSEEIDELRTALKNAEARAKDAAEKTTPSGYEVFHFLSRLQEKGRFLDFVMEDVAGFSDQQIGAAARFVHGGCRHVVREYLELSPVQDGEEGKAVTIFAGRNPAEVRFIGKSADTFPVTGRLVHRGWRVTRTAFPQIAPAPEKAAVLAPAEVEIR